MKTFARFVCAVSALGAALFVGGCTSMETAQVPRRAPVYDFTVVENPGDRKLTEADLVQLQKAVEKFLAGQGVARRGEYFVRVDFPPTEVGVPADWVIVKLTNLPSATYTLVAAYPAMDFSAYDYRYGYWNAPYGYYDPFDYSYGYYSGSNHIPPRHVGGHRPRDRHPGDHKPGDHKHGDRKPGDHSSGNHHPRANEASPRDSHAGNGRPDREYRPQPADYTPRPPDRAPRHSGPARPRHDDSGDRAARTNDSGRGRSIEPAPARSSSDDRGGGRSAPSSSPTPAASYSPPAPFSPPPEPMRSSEPSARSEPETRGGRFRQEN